MGIDHINIVVSNLEESKSFFELLGFRKTAEAKLEGEWISKIVGLKNVVANYIALAYPGAETKIELIKYISPESEKDAKLSKSNQMGFRHIALKVSDIYGEVERLKKYNVKFIGEPIEKHGKKLVYMLGPDGIIIEFAEYE